MTLLKEILLGVTLIVILATGAVVWAKSSTILALDMRNMPELPRHFRNTQQQLPANINPIGFSNLRIAGGGQFSTLALKQVLSALQTKDLVIIDLRQEAHGFLNDNAISWYGYHNANNANKTDSFIEADQAELLNNLAGETVAVVYKLLQKSPDGDIQTTKPVEYLVHQTSSEEELVTSMGLSYERVYVQDFHAPTSAQVDRFIQIVTQVPKNKWIYFHCRAGIGRTTTFMAMYDMMHNAKQVSFEQILARQLALGGRDLTQLPDKRNYKYQWALDRLNFMKSFYEYARKNDDDFKTSWTMWKKRIK